MPDAARAPHPATPWQRHALLKVDPRAWPVVLSDHPLGHLPLLESWADRSWPLIVRRAAPEDDPGKIAVGVPLPPSEGKLRIALSVPPTVVTGRQSLPRLDQVATVAPTSWRSVLEDLIALGDRLGVAPSCYGSLCWEFLTGLSYVTAASDLDILWPVAADTDLARLVEAIDEVERTSGLRLDGEIARPDGRAVNWRELHKALGAGGTNHVIVKTIDGAQLAPVYTFIAAQSVT